MTWRGRLVSSFPVLHIFLVFFFLLMMVKNLTWPNLLFFLLSLYIFPVFTFRVHNLIYPLKEGIFDLAEPRYNAWWASHMFQYLFIAFPFLETPFHFLPGGYSFWIRCWGGKVGKHVYWTPRVEVLDRSLISIGDYVVVGHISTFCSHMIVSMRGRSKLFVKRITVGDSAFIGADSQMGPGAKVVEGEKLKPKTRRYWVGTWN